MLPPALNGNESMQLRCSNLRTVFCCHTKMWGWNATAPTLCKSDHSVSVMAASNTRITQHIPAVPTLYTVFLWPTNANYIQVCCDRQPPYFREQHAGIGRMHCYSKVP